MKDFTSATVIWLVDEPPIVAASSVIVSFLAYPLP